MAVGEFKPGIGGVPLPGQKKKLHSVFPVGEGEAAPAWVAFDRKVLNFSGYFLENVHITKNDEQFRIRKVKVYFYLEDDSVQVNEPQIENSGIPQGQSEILDPRVRPAASTVPHLESQVDFII